MAIPSTNIHLPCPFCDKTVVSQQLFRHIWRFHEAQIISKPENLRLFDPSDIGNNRKRPLAFTLPHDKTFYCCFGCMRGYKKQGHDKRHERCKDAHLAKVDELWEKYKVAPLPSANPVTVVAAATAAPTVITDYTPIERVMWEILKQYHELSRERAGLRQHIEDVKEYLDENGKIAADVFEDFQKEEADYGVIDDAWDAAADAVNQMPFKIDLQAWAEKFEKYPTSHKQMINAQSDKKYKHKPPPKPAPKPEEPESRPMSRPTVLPATKAEPPKNTVVQPSLPTYTYKAPEPKPQPAFPPILANTKVTLKK